MKYEYTVVEAPMVSGRRLPEAKRTLADWFNSMGDDGWQLVTQIPWGHYDGLMVFSRPDTVAEYM